MECFFLCLILDLIRLKLHGEHFTIEFTHIYAQFTPIYTQFTPIYSQFTHITPVIRIEIQV